MTLGIIKPSSSFKTQMHFGTSFNALFFQRLEESVANMKANADALNRDIATIHSNIVQEYNTLKGYSWK
ncbi:hypothetical protein ACSLOD_28420, partial [Escherichia coli]